jgi:hypothetical protein
MLRSTLRLPSFAPALDETQSSAPMPNSRLLPRRGTCVRTPHTCAALQNHRLWSRRRWSSRRCLREWTRRKAWVAESKSSQIALPSARAMPRVGVARLLETARAGAEHRLVDETSGRLGGGRLTTSGQTRNRRASRSGTCRRPRPASSVTLEPPLPPGRVDSHAGAFAQRLVQQAGAWSGKVGGAAFRPRHSLSYSSCRCHQAAGASSLRPSGARSRIR